MKDVLAFVMAGGRGARLMPLHVLLAGDGRVLACGPTLTRVAGELTGKPVLEC